MKIQLSDHFSYGRLFRFTIPSIIMMIFTSVYSMIDGLFVSNFVGITPFAALNLIFPFVQILSCIGRPGRLNEENRQRLKACGARIRDCRPYKNPQERDIVTNYHIKKIMGLREDLLNELES